METPENSPTSSPDNASSTIPSAPRNIFSSPTHYLAFIALCLLWASAWLVDGAWPNPFPTPASQGLHYLVATLIASAAASRDLPHLRQTPWPALAFAAIGLLGVPVMLVDVTSGTVPNPMSVALFALIPIAILILAPHWHPPEKATGPGLPSALIALTGTLLLLPFALPNTYRQAGFEVLILLAVVVAAASSLHLYTLLPAFTLPQALAVVCAANALFFLAAAVIASKLGQPQLTGFTRTGLHTQIFTTILYDLPQLILLLWLMRVIEPARFATRYFLVPLLTILEGDVLLRPGFTVRSAAGMLLVVLGVVRMLTANEPAEEPRLILR